MDVGVVRSASASSSVVNNNQRGKMIGARELQAETMIRLGDDVGHWLQQAEAEFNEREFRNLAKGGGGKGRRARW